MAAKIKLQRIGTKNKPYFRVVVQDESAAPASKVIAILGKYHPLKQPTVFEVDRDKTTAWIKKGAEPTEKVRILLGKAGIMPPLDLSLLHKKKSKSKKAEEEKPAGPAVAEVPANPTIVGKATTKEEQK
jgi:small subunit ribosomal protein S16